MGWILHALCFCQFTCYTVYPIPTMSIPDRVLQFCLPTQNISRNPVTYPDGYFLYSVSRVYFQFQKKFSQSRNLSRWLFSVLRIPCILSIPIKFSQSRNLSRWLFSVLRIPYTFNSKSSPHLVLNSECQPINEANPASRETCWRPTMTVISALACVSFSNPLQWKRQSEFFC